MKFNFNLKKFILWVVAITAAVAASIGFIVAKAEAHGLISSTEISSISSDLILTSTIGYSIAYSGLRSDHRVKRMTTGISMLAVNHLVTETLKNVTGRTRPDGSDKKSFPSGHTSAAFTAAAFVCSQRVDAHCYVTTFMAGTVGILRVMAKRHHISDVIAGMAIGVFHGAKGPEFYPALIMRF